MSKDTYFVRKDTFSNLATNIRKLYNTDDLYTPIEINEHINEVNEEIID
jgi:hypothetical protein